MTQRVAIQILCSRPCAILLKAREPGIDDVNPGLREAFRSAQPDSEEWMNGLRGDRIRERWWPTTSDMRLMLRFPDSGVALASFLIAADCKKGLDDEGVPHMMVRMPRLMEEPI